MPEERIGKYVVVGEAGRGGMGIVYHARDESLNRDVAIKVLPESTALDAKRMARFQREGKVLASLNHTNIATIYEIGQHNDHLFVVLEYVPGQTLDELIRRSAIPWRKMLPIAIQIAAAMEYAHDQGIIHRDLKPLNIKFDERGHVKVLDFGLAKALDENDPEEDANESLSDRATLVALSDASQDASATRPGAMMGTVGYLSPEQACGKPVDKQTDIFSFGCILFEMLTGNAPFASDSAVDAIGRTLHKDPEWAQLPQNIPTQLKALLQRCLAKEKQDRLRDIGDARLELIELQEFQDDEPATITEQRSSPALLAVAIVAVLIAIALGVLYGLDKSQPIVPIQQTAAPLTHRAIKLPEHLTPGVFSSTPDDAYIRLVCTNEVPSEKKGGPPQLEFRIYVRPRDSDELRAIHKFTGFAGFAFSPDGESYVLNYNGLISRGRIDSDVAPVELARIQSPANFAGGFWLFPAKRGIVWFDEETLVVETLNDQAQPELVLLNAKTGDIKKHVPLILESNDLRRDGLIGKFDDDHVLMYVSLYNDEGFSINLATASLKTGELKVLVERAGDAQLIGDQVFFTRNDALHVASYDPKEHKLLDAGQPVMQGLFSKYAAHALFDISDNGTLIYLPGGVQGADRRIMINTGEGAQATELVNAPYDNALAVSGDGSSICSTRLRDDGMWEIWGGTFDPPRMRKILAKNDADYCFPMLSYDGSTLGCVQITTTPNGVELAYVVAPVDGSRSKELVRKFTDPDEMKISCFSLDNQRVMADMPDPNSANNQRYLVEVDLKTGEISEVLSRVGGARNGLWSPDGKIISFQTLETGVPELHVYNPANGNTQAVSHIPIGVQRWVEHPDGSLSLIYWDDEWGVWESTIALDDAGAFAIGQATPHPHIDSPMALHFTMDNRGNVYTIEAGEDDGAPKHLVVIENWLDSIDVKKK